MEGINLYKHKFTKGKLYTSLSLSLLLTLSIPIISRAVGDETSSPEKNLFYMEVINYTMPFVKSVALNEDEVAEYNYSIKNKLLQIVGLDVGNPLSIVERELGFINAMNSEETQHETKTSFFINPFKLSESTINKNTENNNANNNTQNVNPPNINIAQVYNPKIKKTLNPAKPEVLIYHSHTTESYKPYKENMTVDSENMNAVGDVIANDLEKNYGIATIHDKSYNNIGNFYHSYENSGALVDKYLNKYKDFKLIIDLHRDGLPDNTAASVFETNLNKTNLARYMIVIGTGNKNKSSNIAVAKKISSISQSLFPGLIRPGNGGSDYGIHYYESARFNQHKSGNAILIELGAQNNTLDEAKASGLYLSRIIAEYINSK